MKFQVLAPCERLLASALGIRAEKRALEIGRRVVNRSIRTTIQDDVRRQDGDAGDVSDARDPLQ